MPTLGLIYFCMFVDDVQNDIRTLTLKLVSGIINLELNAKHLTLWFKIVLHFP